MNGTAYTDSIISDTILSIQNRMQQAIRNNILPGATILVNQNGRTVYQEAFGMADREAARPQCIDDLFYLGSTSKPLAVTSILTLVNDGRIELKTPASIWIPELNHCKLTRGKISRAPTLEELLSHTSGIFGNATATPRQQRLVWNFGSNLAHTATLIAKQAYTYEPSKGFSYGGASMTLASRIAELITGMEFDQFASNFVFDKLGMKDTFYRTDKDFKNRFSTLYNTSAGKLFRAQFQPHAAPESFVLPAGGIISTANDLSAFMQFHLNNFKPPAGDILSHDLKTRMRTDATNRNPMDFKTASNPLNTTGPANTKGYGMGWMLDEIDDNLCANIFFHGGAFGTLIWGDYKTKLCIILLTHVPFAHVAQLWDEIINKIRTALG